MSKLTGLQPERPLYYFEEMTAIPHGSGNMKAISEYCVNFAKAHKLDYIKDTLGNVIIKKPGSKGYEDHPTLIIQGHLDMVCDKAPDVDFDFEKDALNLGVDGDWLHANGTTLGADDGVALAYAFAILESDTISHPPLEVLMTVDEEIGLLGAAAMDCSRLQGRRLLSLDGGSEGLLLVGCAGGIRADVTLPIAFTDNNKNTYKVTVSGLHGGHSGSQIDKGYLNANKVMGEFLKTLTNYNLVSIDGGAKDNAIAMQSTCVLATDADIISLGDSFANAHRVDADPDLTVSVERVETAKRVFTDESTKRVVGFLVEAPNGIVAMSQDIDGLVETSLNLGILETSDDSVRYAFGIRSSVGNEKKALLERVNALAEQYGGTCSGNGDYPAWEYRKDSRLRDTMCSLWEKMYGEKPQVMMIHAGLECGYFSEKIDGLDAVNLGPDMEDIHTCRERLSISSFERTYRFMCELLKNL